MKLKKMDKYKLKFKYYYNNYFLRLLSAAFSVSYIGCVNYILLIFLAFCYISGKVISPETTLKFFDIKFIDNLIKFITTLFKEDDSIRFISYLHVNSLSVVFIILYLITFRVLVLRLYTSCEDEDGYFEWFTTITFLPFLLYFSFYNFELKFSPGHWRIWKWLKWKPEYITNIEYFFEEMERFNRIHYFVSISCLILFVYIVIKEATTHNTELYRKYFGGYWRVSFKCLYVCIFFSIMLYLYKYTDFLGHNKYLYELGCMENKNFIKPLVPEWYHMPFVFIASFIPEELRFLVFTLTYLVLILFPCLNRSKKWSSNPKRLMIHKIISISLIIVFILLGYIGVLTMAPWSMPILSPTILESVGYVCFFLFFFIIFIILPFMSLFENIKK